MAIVCPTLDVVETIASKPMHGARDTAKSDLDPVQYHLQAALEAMRMIPVSSVERERFFGWIYNLMASANNLIADDHYSQRTGKVGPATPDSALLSDLDFIKG